MPTYRSELSITVLGKTYKSTKSPSADGVVKKDPTVPGAKAGSLTVRGSDTAGTITMTAGGHGITTGAKLDVYWSNGSRTVVTVGTVSSNSIPISSGSGDNLPVQGTAVMVMVPQSEPFPLTGDNATLLLASCPERATVTLSNVDDSSLVPLRINPRGNSYSWESTSGITNPVAGLAITKAYVSHAIATPTVVEFLALFG